MKKIILIISLILVAALSFVVWNKLNDISSKSINVLALIPSNSTTIISVKFPENLLIKAEENLSIFSELKENLIYQKCKNLHQAANSIFAKNTQSQEAYVSIKNGKDEDWALVISKRDRAKNITSVVKTYREAEYDEFIINNKKIYIYDFEQTTYISFSMLVVQELIAATMQNHFLDYQSEKISINALSGADFFMLKKGENSAWQMSDFFINNDNVEVISQQKSTKNQVLRLWSKLPRSVNSKFSHLPDSSYSPVLTGEMGVVTSKGVPVLMLGLNKSLHYSLIENEMVFDSLNSKKFSFLKTSLEKLTGEISDFNTKSDTIYGVEDLDFALFSSSKDELNSVYFELKKVENVAQQNKLEELIYYAKSTFINELSKEEKIYYSDSDYSIRKTVIQKDNSSSQVVAEKHKWKISFNQSINNIFKIKNHRSGNVEVLVQESDNRLSLIDVNGKIRWTIPVDGNIIGGVSQVDIFKNGKLQMLFNTSSKLYLIDVLGRNLEGFPIVISGRATNQVAAIDYENTKEYRFLIATQKGVLNYNINGKKVNGFSFNKLNLDVKSQLVHKVISGNDYIMFNDAQGSLYFLNRRGEERFKTTVKQNSLDVFTTFQAAGSIVSSSIYGLNNTRNLTQIMLGSEGKSIVKDSAILNQVIQTTTGKKYMLGISDRSVYIYTKTGNLIREISCDFSPKTVVSQINSSQDGKLLIKSNINDVYLFDLYSDAFIDAFKNVTGKPLIEKFNTSSDEAIILIEDSNNLVYYPIN